MVHNWTVERMQKTNNLNRPTGSFCNAEQKVLGRAYKTGFGLIHENATLILLPLRCKSARNSTTTLKCKHTII